MEDDASLAAHRRGPWSQHEDGCLMSLVHRHGPLNWVRIASTLGSRTPKQCRERFHQNLKPTLNHEPITAEEGAQIEKLVGEIGKKWAEIARRLHGRSDNAVKNWWNGSQNRRKRFDRRRNANTVMSGEEYYHRTASLGSQLGLPPPNALQAPIDHHRPQGSWSEAPLPSPCASESPDLDGYHHHYTTSPAPGRANVLPYHHREAVELPPLRTLPAPGIHASHASHASHVSHVSHVSQMPTAVLPSLSSLGQQQIAHGDAQKRQHLLTAPNSPIQPQQQHQQQASGKPRDTRMNLSSLLG